MNDNNNKRGFSGLSDLTSVVRGVNETEKPELKKDAEPTPSKPPSQPHRDRTSTHSKSDSTASRVDTTSSGSSTSGPWILVFIGLVLVIWIIKNDGQNKRTTSPRINQNTELEYPSTNNLSEIPSAERNEEPQKLLTNYDTLSMPQNYGYTLSETAQGITAQDPLQNTSPSYEKPSVGSNNILDVPQIRWCIREGIRIDAMRDVSDSNQGIGKFNQIVDDYNRRCGSYRYRQDSVSRARRDVEPFRSQIVSKAIGEARQFDSSYKPLSPSISSGTFTTETPEAEYTREAQKLLTDLGYEPGPIDGDYGRRTESAIKSFQKAQGLTVDGVVDKNLLETLRLEINERTDTLISRANATSKLTVKDASRYLEANRLGVISTCKQQGSTEYVDNCQKNESINLNHVEANTERLLAEENTMLRQQQRELMRLRTLYFNSIRKRVERNWHKPAGFVGQVNCTISVLQSPVGEVLNVKVDDCYGNNVALRKSVENAVWAASPLPAAPDPKLFDRRVRFFFRPS